MAVGPVRPDGLTRREARARHKRALAAWRLGQGPRPDPLHEPWMDARKARRAAEREAGAVSRAPAVTSPDPVARAEARDETRRLREEHARLVEQLREERQRNAFLGEISRAAPPKILPAERSSGLRELCAVVIGSDWHVEERVEPIKVAHRNAYDLEIADRSIKRFFRGAVDLVQHHRASERWVVRDMVCALSGDLMTGWIHEELQQTAALSPVETILWLQPRIRDGLHTLLKELDLRTLVVPCSYGNHGRTTRKVQSANGAECSYEWMMYRALEREFATEPRIRFDTTPATYQYTRVYDFDLGFTHGDHVRYEGGVGGLSVPLLKALPGMDDVHYCHYWHLGHHHQFRDFGRALVNGSMVGFTPHSGRGHYTFEAPQQAFYLLDSKRGKTCVSPIWVRELYTRAPEQPVGRALS